MSLTLLSALVDRVIQLVNHRQQAKEKVLNEQVTPAFGAFEQVHQQYLTSFTRYRETLKSSGEPLTLSHPLFDTLRSDNLFTEHERTRILTMGSAADSQLGEFVRLVRDYVVDVRVSSDPIAGFRGHRFANPQHWRRTLIGELEAIFDERWQIVLDPNSARPPLYGEELDAALLEARRAAGIPDHDTQGLEKLKRAFALRALDDVVADMQESYAGVATEYARLQQNLR
jgi:hypothetical protein